MHGLTAYPSLAPSTETGTLGVYHLKRLWSVAAAERAGAVLDRPEERNMDRLVLDGLGLGLQQTFRYLYVYAPSFSAFEAWIIDTAGRPAPDRLARLNADLMGTLPPEATQKRLAAIAQHAPVLSPADLAHWHTHGYVVLRDAVTAQARCAAEQVIWQHLGAHPDQPDTWYRGDRPGIMVELIQHPAFEAIRWATRIHKAFAQLWGTPDLWATADRCGFHPPQRSGCPFPGPDLHWDMNLDRPDAFATQGILYLTHTPPEQGAFTLVPGFHHRLADWLQALPPGADPHAQDLHALGSRPIGGQAGDLIIWHHGLPHGSRPNLGSRPRMVQYLNMYPGRHVSTSG